MGHPNGSSSLGLDGNGIHTFIANYDTKAWIVGRIDMHGEADADANPDVYFWIDPPKDAEPDVLGAEITTSWPSLKSGFNRIRLGGDSNGGIMLVDNFVMGNKFSDLYTYKPDTGTLVKKAVSEQKTLIRASQGMIEILDVAGKNVAVYSIEGHKLYSNKSNTSNLRVNLKQGIYIVLVNNFSQKVVVVE